VIAQVDVHGATDDLEGTVTGVHDDESHSVSALNGANLVDPSDDHVFKPLAHALDAFDDQTEVVEDHAKVLRSTQ